MKKKNGKEKVSTVLHFNQREYDEMLLNQDQSLPNQDQNLEQQLHMYFSQLVSGLRQNNQSPPTNEIIDHSKQFEVGRSESNPKLRGRLPRKRKLQYVNRCSQEPQITQCFIASNNIKLIQLYFKNLLLNFFIMMLLHLILFLVLYRIMIFYRIKIIILLTLKKIILKKTTLMKILEKMAMWKMVHLWFYYCIK